MLRSSTQVLQALQLNLFFARAGLETFAQRSRQGPRKPNWSWRFESAVRAMTGLTPNHADIVVDEIRDPFNRITNLPLWLRVAVEPVKLGAVPGEWVTVSGAQS